MQRPVLPAQRQEDEVKAILGERSKTHGYFPNAARLSQELKAVLKNHRGNLSPAQREAIDMIFHKIARIVFGDANFRDHWADIAGYAMLAPFDVDDFRDHLGCDIASEQK